MMKLANKLKGTFFEKALLKYPHISHIIFKYQSKIYNNQMTNAELQKIIQQNNKEYIDLDNKWKKWLTEANKTINTQKEDLECASLDKLIFSFLDSKYDVLKLSDYDSDERKYIHMRCDQLNLKHESIDEGENRILVIEKTEDFDINIIGQTVTKSYRDSDTRTYECQSCGSSISRSESFVSEKS